MGRPRGTHSPLLPVQFNDSDAAAIAAASAAALADAAGGPLSPSVHRAGTPSKLPREESCVESIMAVLPTVYVPSCVFGLADGVIISTVPLLSRRMGSSDKVVGLTAAASLIGKLAADMPAGQVHERLGGCVAMTLGLAGVCVTSVLAFACRSPLLLFASLVLTGCCEAVFSVSRGTVVRAAVPARHRGRAVALLGGINRIARSIGPVLGAYCSTRYGMWHVLLLRAVLAAAGAVMLYRQAPEGKHAAHTTTTRSIAATAPVAVGDGGGGGKGKGAGAAGGGAVKSIWSTVVENRESLLTGGVVAFAMALVRQARNVVLSLKGDDVGVSLSNIGYAFSAGYAFDSFLFIPVGWAMDMYGRKWCGVPAFFVLSLGLLLVPTVTTAEGLVWASAVMAVGNGLSSGLLMTIGTDLAPRAFAGQFIGVWHLVCDAGALCGPLLLGVISDATTLDTSAYVCAAVGVAGGLWFALVVVETLRDTAL